MAAKLTAPDPIDAHKEQQFSEKFEGTPGPIVVAPPEPSTAELLNRLRAPFPPDAISKLPKGKEDKDKRKSCAVCKGYHDPSMIHLDYVGHANVTDRLLSVDPFWTWEPLSFDAQGSPALVKGGEMLALWIRLTILGVTRIGVGTCPANKGEALKELVGDAIRNAAMRFGVALDLWAKGGLESHEREQVRAEAVEQEPPEVPLRKRAYLAALKVCGDKDEAIEYLGVLKLKAAGGEERELTEAETLAVVEQLEAEAKAAEA